VHEPLRFHVRPRLRDAALVLAFEGWNDAGESATTAARFLIDALAPAPLAEIDPEDFHDFTVRRPRIEIPQGGARRIVWPTYELRYGSIDAQRELVVGVGSEPHLRWRRYAELLVGLASELGLRRVVLLGAYLADVLYSRPVAVSGFATPPDRLDGLGVLGSSYQGPTGIVGVLAEGFAKAGVEVLSLWAALPHYISAQPNPRGALALLQAAQPALDLKLDVAPLERAAADFEQRISEIVAADPELAEYVRQLKRREFEGDVA
jgi:proteasome assembly chaperone (PAC2) family protein